VVICHPPPPGSDVVQGRQAYYSLEDKVPIFHMDGPRRLVADNRIPSDIPIRLPVRSTDAIVITSSPLASPASHSPDGSSDVIVSSPQPSVRVPKKRKAVVDSPSLQSDDDLYLPDSPKPKRAKSVASKPKAPAKKESKGKESSVKGKGKVPIVKEKEERPARAKQSKKVVKSVAFIEDEDDNSLDDTPPAARPKPKPAYHGAKGLREPSLEDSQKDTASTPTRVVQPPAHAVSNSIPAVVRSTSDYPLDGQPKPSVEHATQMPAIPTVSADAVSRPVLAVPTVPTRATDPQPTEGQYPPHEPHPPPHSYAADERNQYYHGRLSRNMDGHPYGGGGQLPIHYQNPGPSRYAGDEDVPPERYGFRGDYYGYMPHSREYYGPQYPHAMHPGVQPPYAAPPPAAYHQHLRHDPHQQPDAATAPGGLTGNAMASSSRLSPPNHHAKSA